MLSVGISIYHCCVRVWGIELKIVYFMMVRFKIVRWPRATRIILSRRQFPRPRWQKQPRILVDMANRKFYTHASLHVPSSSIILLALKVCGVKSNRVVEACAMMLPPMGFLGSALNMADAPSTWATTWLVITTAIPNYNVTPLSPHLICQSQQATEKLCQAHLTRRQFPTTGIISSIERGGAVHHQQCKSARLLDY